MENTLVSARMSTAKKERAVGVLASIGATTSDLINSAFEYVIAEKRLPTAAVAPRGTAEGFHQFVRESTLDIAWPKAETETAAGDYKAMMRRERLADYESLA